MTKSKATEEATAENIVEAPVQETATEETVAENTAPEQTETSVEAPAETPVVETKKSTNRSRTAGKGLRKKPVPTVYSTDTVTGAKKAEEVTITFDELLRRKYGVTIENMSEGVRDIISFLDRYQGVMGGREVVEETGMSLQRQLYRTYLKILSFPNAIDRNVTMEYLLWKFFDKTSNAFQPVPLARFTRKGNWDISELLMFNSLNSIFDKIKDPGTRFNVLGSMRIGEIVQRFPADKAIFTEGFINWTQSMR